MAKQSVKSGSNNGKPMAPYKSETEKDVTFAKGGDTPMFGPQAAGSQNPATTAHDVKGGAPGPSYAAGGSGKMFGYSPSVPAKAGITSAR